MPLCGFDKGMLEGLEMFYQGLIKAVEKKSKETETTIERALGIEINEMHAFIGELDNLKDEINRQSLTGVTQLAQALYRGAAEYAQKNDTSLTDALNKQKEYLRKLFFKTDEYYEKECRGKANPMKYLVDGINKI